MIVLYRCIIIRERILPLKPLSSLDLMSWKNDWGFELSICNHKHSKKIKTVYEREREREGGDFTACLVFYVGLWRDERGNIWRETWKFHCASFFGLFVIICDWACQWAVLVFYLLRTKKKGLHCSFSAIPKIINLCYKLKIKFSDIVRLSITSYFFYEIKLFGWQWRKKIK